MDNTKTKVKNYQELIKRIDKDLNIIMAELEVISNKRNEIVKKIDSFMTEKKLESIKKKLFNK